MKHWKSTSGAKSKSEQTRKPLETAIGTQAQGSLSFLMNLPTYLI
jgi:hypothetical protein